MIKVNLLPPAEKNKLKLEKLQKKIYFCFLWLAGVLLIFVGLLLSTYFIIQVMLQGQENLIDQRKASQKNKEIALMQERINQANQRLKLVNKKQQTFVVWTPILLEFSDLVPNQVHLTNLSYQEANERLRLSGYAQTREDLLIFEEKLKTSNFFTDLESPLTNIIKQRDINFNFSLKPIPQSGLNK